MGIKVVQLPPLEALRAETVWPGDDAFDPDGSDLKRFLASLGSDTSELKRRGKERPAKIIYRPLRQLELDAALSHGPEMVAYEAFRYGIVEIEGVDLEFRRQPNGLKGISQECLEKLCDGVYMEMPIRHAIDAMNRVSDPNIAPRKGGESARVSLPLMLGIFVQAATFRVRG